MSIFITVCERYAHDGFISIHLFFNGYEARMSIFISVLSRRDAFGMSGMLMQVSSVFNFLKNMNLA